MNKKMRPLTLPVNPLERMRELHELNNPSRQQPSLPASQQASMPGVKPANLLESQPESKTASRLSMQQAILEMLSKPYPLEADKGPMPSVTTRIDKDLLERLELAVTLTGKNKQEIFAEALKQFFDKLSKGKGIKQP